MSAKNHEELTARQSALPRFMYANGEIQKRNEAVGISVRPSICYGDPADELPVLQSVRDLVLHLIADAPPPSWLRVDVSQ